MDTRDAEVHKKSNEGSCLIEPKHPLYVADKEYKWDIAWKSCTIIAYFYIGGIYGSYLLLTAATWPTVFWCVYLYFISILGVTAGAHRLWAHKCYKANLYLRIILAYFQSTCYQNSIHDWVRDHRMHHKFSDTDADPHNASRGFFFSHVGWLLVRKHNDLKEKGKTIFLEDIEADPVVRFQRKYYGILMPLFCFIVPAVVPWYFWGESFATAWYTASIFRYSLSANITWLVNSAAHMYGSRPYDKNISAAQIFSVAVAMLGEGWHNYHHVFPWDYRASEQDFYMSNLTIAFIDFFAKIGWAYDLKTVSKDMVRKRMSKTGEKGSHSEAYLGGKLVTEEDEKYVDIMYARGY